MSYGSVCEHTFSPPELSIKKGVRLVLGGREFVVREQRQMMGCVLYASRQQRIPALRVETTFVMSTKRVTESKLATGSAIADVLNVVFLSV